MKTDKKRRRKMRKIRKQTSRLIASGTPLQFTAAASVNLTAAEGQLPTFEMVAYSGGKLFVKGFEHPVVVDLTATEVKGNDGSIPITLDHNENHRVGHTTSVTVTPTEIVMAGVASAETAWRDEVVASSKNGFKWQASIEGRVMGREFVPSGKRVTVNGRVIDGPVIVAKPFVLRATSFVSSGGDEDNVVRLAASNDTGEFKMNKAFKEWLEGNGFDAELVAQNENQHDFLKAQWEAGQSADTAEEVAETVKASAKVDTVDPIADLRERSAKEVERQSEIAKLCAGEHSDLQAKAIREGWSLVETEVAVLRAARDQQTPAIHVTDKSEVKTGEALEACLLRSVGIDPEKAGYDDKSLSASDKIGTYGLQALMYDCIRASGSYYPGGRKDGDFIRAAFKANDILTANEGFSTLSLTGVLSNVANKALLNSYNSVAGLRRTICKQRQVPDFKAFSSYRVYGNGELLKLGPDGEIKHAELSEDTYTNQIDTYARMMALTRQMMINDDLGAFMEIPQSFGRLSGITEEKVLFTAFGAAVTAGTFFASGNANFLTGATYALSIESLTSAEKLLVEMKDGAGNPILVTPRYLVVPPALKLYADQLYNDAFAMATAFPTTGTARKPNSNPHSGKYQPLTSPFFGTSQGITGISDTHWLMMADPMDIALIEFAELQGQSGPVIEQAETDFNTLGMQWRAYRDFGVAMQDPAAGVYADGTS